MAFEQNGVKITNYTKRMYNYRRNGGLGLCFFCDWNMAVPGDMYPSDVFSKVADAEPLP